MECREWDGMRIRDLQSSPNLQPICRCLQCRVLLEKRATLLSLALLALLVADVLFIGLNLIKIDEDGRLRLMRLLWVGQEWSLPEITQYAKWALLAVALALAYRRWREPIYAVWAAVFATMALDDALSLHELIGRSLSSIASDPLGGRTGYFELIPMAAGAAALLFGLWYAHHREARSSVRRYSRAALVLFALYAVFAVLVDVLKLVASQQSLTDRGSGAYLRILEDGGELLVATMLVALTLWHIHRMSAASTRTSGSAI